MIELGSEANIARPQFENKDEREFVNLINCGWRGGVRMVRTSRLAVTVLAYNKELIKEVVKID